MENEECISELETCEFKLDKPFLKVIREVAKESEMEFEEFVAAALNVAVQVVQGHLVIMDPHADHDHNHEDGGCCGGSNHDSDGGCGCNC